MRMSDKIHIIEFYDNEGGSYIHKEYFLDKDQATDLAEEILFSNDYVGFHIFNLCRSNHDFS